MAGMDPKNENAMRTTRSPGNDPMVDDTTGRPFAPAPVNPI
jgi:hypothetical protein